MFNHSHFPCANRPPRNLRCASPASIHYCTVLLIAVPFFALGALGQQTNSGPVSEPQTTPAAPTAGHSYVPESSKPQPLGFAHTNYVLRSLDGNKPSALSVSSEPGAVVNPDATIELPETPASMGCLYVQSPSLTGCVPKGLSQKGGPSAAGYGAIALVDAYDNPDAASDLATFDSNFGLAAANFTKVYANGNGACTTPPANTGWALEESLDIEWAHVFAPNAAIVLVEACSNSDTNLFYAEQVAFEYIVNHYPGGGQVSNSWGGGEFSGETADDEYFSDLDYSGATGWTSHITAFASAGDTGSEVAYPSVSPWVVSAGGTSVLRNTSNDYFSSESCWSDSGGGTSTYETYTTSFTGGNTGPWADFQYPIFAQGARSVPDMSFNADPSSGVYVYSQYYGGWYQVGGTSVSSPSLASIVNRAGNRLSSYLVYPILSNGYFTTGENNLLYSEMPGAKTYAADFYDVTTGSNGHSAYKYYDQCTGVGSPRGIIGK